MKNKDISELSIVDFFTFAKKYWVFVFCIGLVGASSSYYTYTTSFKYRASADFSVISANSNHVQELTEKLSGLSRDFKHGAMENTIAKYEQYFNSQALGADVFVELKQSNELHILSELNKSNSIFGRLLNLFKKEKLKEPSPDQLKSLISSGINLKRESDTSNVLRAVVESNSAETSARIANIAVYTAIKNIVNRDLREVHDSKDFLKAQIQETQSRIRGIEQELSKLQHRKEFLSQKQNISSKRNLLLGNELSEVQGKVLQLQALQTKYKKRAKAQGYDYLLKIKKDKVEQELFLLNTKMASINEQMAKYKSNPSMSMKGFSQGIKIQDLDRQKEFEYTYLADLKKLNLEMKVKEVSIRNRARVLSYAKPSSIAAKGIPFEGILSSFLVALCFGILFFTLKEHVSPEINNREDIEHNQLVDFGTIPDFAGFGGLSRIKWTFNKKSDESSLEHNSKLKITNNSPQDFAFGRVRSKIQYALNDSEYDLRVVTLTSPRQGEGKTHISGKLAYSLAKANEKVLLIDGDLIRKDLSTLMGLDQNNGFRQLLTGENKAEELIVKDPQLSNLSILPAGHGRGTAADALLTDNCMAFFENCRETYDVIIIDTPALLVAPDALLFARLSDITTLVVSEGQSKMNDLKRAYADLKGNGVDRIGSILNRTDGILKYVYHQPKKKKSYKRLDSPEAHL